MAPHWTAARQKSPTAITTAGSSSHAHTIPWGVGLGGVVVAVRLSGLAPRNRLEAQGCCEIVQRLHRMLLNSRQIHPIPFVRP